MRRMALRTAAVGFTIGTAVVALAPLGAHADAPTQQGWWTVANPGGLPANPATATAADVPSDGLLVQSGPVDPTSPCNCTAYAGLIYELSDGTSAGDLTLKVAPNSASTPVATLELCPLVNAGMQTEQGGPLSDAPDYSCGKHVNASLSAGGSSFTFHVKSLVSDGILAVAILPGDSTTRAVLSKPDSSSLATVVSTMPSNPSFPSTSSAPATSAGGGAVPSSSGSSVSQPSITLPQQPGVGGSDTGQTPVVAPPPSTTPLVATPVAATTGTSGSTPVAVIILLAGLAVGAALWSLAGRGPVTDVPEG